MRRKILVIRGGAIGDFILTFPAIAALRSLQPADKTRHLEILGYPRIANLALAAGLADATRSIESPSLAPFFTLDSSLPPEEIRYFQQFDLIVSYIYDPEQIFAKRVMSITTKLDDDDLSGSGFKANPITRYIAGPHRPKEGQPIHATAVFLRPIIDLGIENTDPQPKLEFPNPPSPQTEALRTQWLAVHPGSGSERKNWPEANWASLLDQLIKRTSWNILLISGEAEGDRPRRLAANLPTTRIQLAQNLSLVDLAQKLRCCSQFIGHDSGITHLAAALGLPILALWGETDADIWRPISPKVKLLRHPGGLKALPVQVVSDSIDNLPPAR